VYSPKAPTFGAPNSKYRAVVTPAGRGRGNKPKASDEDDQTAAEKRASMSWAMRLKRVFNIDIENCSECGGEVRITVPAHPCAHGISASMHVIASIA